LHQQVCDTQSLVDALPWMELPERSNVRYLRHRSSGPPIFLTANRPLLELRLRKPKFKRSAVFQQMLPAPGWQTVRRYLLYPAT